jgi:hypothetical protein
MALCGISYYHNRDKLDSTMKLFKFRPKTPDVSEITQYTNDLETLSIMRDKAEKNGNFDEAALHSETIKIMQLCLQFLLERK